MVMGKIFKSILVHENIKALSLTITSPMLNDTTLMAKSKEDLKSLLMKVKEELA